LAGRFCGLVGPVSDGLAVAEEFVVLVVAAVATADVVEVGDELDTLDPCDEFEAELDLVAQPQWGAVSALGEQRNRESR
jgi:hypothetical protein